MVGQQSRKTRQEEMVFPQRHSGCGRHNFSISAVLRHLQLVREQRTKFAERGELPSVPSSVAADVMA